MRFNSGLLSQRDVGLDVWLRAVDRAQDAAPAPVLVTGRFFRGRLKTPTAQLLKSCQSGFVKRRCHVPLDFIAVGVLVVVHPRQQRGSDLIRVGTGGLPGFDPAADQGLGKFPEAAAGVIEFIGLPMTSRQEGLAKRGGTCGVDCDVLVDGRGDFLKAAHERKAFVVADECSGVKRQLDLALKRVCFAVMLAFHPE